MTPEQLVRSILQLDPSCKLYRTLGIDSTADQAAVQQSYLRRARMTHPDKNPTPGAEEAFKRVAHARSVLCDTARRAAYDSALRSAGPHPAERSRPFERRAAQKRQAHSSGRHQAESHAAGSGSEGAGGSGSGSEEAGGSGSGAGMWCSWQARTPTSSPTGDHYARPRLSKAAKARRRASGKEDSAAAAAAAAAIGTVGNKGAVGGGQGRGHLGKRPWRREARLQAKKEAKLNKARTKARRHLQSQHRESQ